MPKPVRVPPWKEFEQQVAELFRLMEHEVDCDIDVRSGQTDVLAISPRNAKPNLLIEFKYSDSGRNVSIKDAEHFVHRTHNLRHKGVVDHGYLITNTGFTHNAKGHVFDDEGRGCVFLYTYRELLHRLIDTQFYLANYVREYEERRDRERFVDLSVVGKRLPCKTARGNSRPTGPDSQIGSVQQLTDFVHSEAGGILLLLGDFGCGKTTIMRHMMYLLATAALGSVPKVLERGF